MSTRTAFAPILVPIFSLPTLHIFNKTTKKQTLRKEKKKKNGLCTEIATGMLGVHIRVCGLIRVCEGCC